MSRDLTTAFSDELEAAHVNIAYFFEGDFASSYLRLWTGLGDITWDSKTWAGNGWLHDIKGGGETSDIKATNMEIALAGVPSSVISLVLTEASQNRLGNLYLAFLDANEVVIADPYLLFTGKFDTAEINDGADGAIVTLSYETQLVELEKAEERRFTDATQKSIYADDRGLEYITEMAEWDGFWVVLEERDKRRKSKPEKTKRRH